MAGHTSGICTLVLSVLCLAGSTVAQSFATDCNKDNSVDQKYDYEVRCPYINNAFYFYVKEGEKADFSCDPSISYEDILSKWRPPKDWTGIGKVNHFTITNCPLPESSIYEFTHNIFNATGFKLLEINRATGSLSDFHLANLTELRYLTLSYMKSERLDASFFQGLTNLVYLKIKSIINFDISSDAFHGLTKLKEVSLDNNNILSLAPDQFQGLSSLQKLNLHKNKLTQLDAGLFADLTNLTDLTMSENKLTSLPTGIFDSLGNLENIKMGENFYESLPNGLFSKALKLKNIDMTLNNDHCNYRGPVRPENSNFFKKLSLDYCLDKVNKIDIPTDLFQIPSLEILKMIYFPINSMPQDIFKGAVNLQNVTIQTTYSGNFPPNIFADSKNIVGLDLAGNNIRQLPKSIFSGMHKLLTLELMFNSITNLTEAIFDDLDNLKELKLHGNLISDIHRDSFRFLKNLEYLDLADNAIVFSGRKEEEFLSSGVFQQLRTLKLTNNSFSELEANIFNTFQNLEKLDLSHNSFRKFVARDWQNFSQIKRGTTIDLSHNQIERVDFSSKPVDNLLDSNLNGGLDGEGKQSSPSLVKLRLDGNPIVCDCFITELKQLLEGTLNNVWSARFQVLQPQPGGRYNRDGEIRATDQVKCSENSPPHLSNVSLVEVEMKHLSCDFPSPQLPDPCPKNCACSWNRHEKLIYVNCEMRNFLNIPECLPSLSSQRDVKFLSLDLSGNKIVNITDAIKQDILAKEYNSSRCGNLTGRYDNIKYLNLSNNQLEHLEPAGLPASLVNLDVSGNRLTSFTNIDLEKMTKGDFTLYLGQNPFSCSCESENLYKFASSSKNILDSSDIIINCSPNTRKSLLKSNLKDFCEKELPPGTIAGVSLAVIFCIFAAVMAVFYAMYSDSIQIWIYSKEWLRFMFDDELIDSDKPYDAFISYSHHDADFVNELLLPGLEAPEDSSYKYRCLTHEKDWLVGQPIPDNILDSVQSSRRTIIVLSKNFIKSHWSTMEFRAAHTQALQDKTQRVVIILRGELPDEEAMKEFPELRNYIKLNTYIESESPWFWERLRYALPHRGSGGLLSARRRRKRTRRETDQLELMKAQAEAELKSGNRTPSPPTISALVDSNGGGETKICINGNALDNAFEVPNIVFANGQQQKPANHKNGTAVIPAVNGGTNYLAQAQNAATLSNGGGAPTSNGNGYHTNGGFNLNDSGRQVRKIITAQ